MNEDIGHSGSWEDMLSSHIRDKQAGPLACPICSAVNSFEPKGTIGGRMADDILQAEYQFGYAACNNCGYSIFFDAKITDLWFEDSSLGDVGPYMSELQAVVQACAENILSPTQILKSDAKKAIIEHSKAQGRSDFDNDRKANDLLYFFMRNGWLPEDRDYPRYVWINDKTLDFLYD